MARNSNRTPLSHTRYVDPTHPGHFHMGDIYTWITSSLSVHSHSSTAPSHTSESRGQTPSSFNEEEDEDDEDDDNPSSPEWPSDSRAVPGRNATQEISCHSSLYYHIFNPFLPFSQFGTKRQESLTPGETVNCTSVVLFGLESHRSGHRGERFSEG